MFPFIKNSGRLPADFSAAKVISAQIDSETSALNMTLSLTQPAPPHEISVLEEMISGEYGLAAAVGVLFSREDRSSTGDENAVDAPGVKEAAAPYDDSADAIGFAETAATKNTGGKTHSSVKTVSDGHERSAGAASHHTSAASHHTSAASHHTGVASAPAGTVSAVSAKSSASAARAAEGKLLMGKRTRGKTKPMDQVTLELGKVTVSGEVCDITSRYIEKSRAWVLSFDLTDHTGTLHISKFLGDNDARAVVNSIKHGMWLTVSGKLSISNYDSDLMLDPVSIVTAEHVKRTDTAAEKRVELHLHTKMSALDAVTDTAGVIKRAVQWGHPAVAITDHGVVHSFPEAAEAAAAEGDSIKVIYGVEGYFFNDTEYTTAVHGCSDSFESEFVVFDIETSGLSAVDDVILEIGAVLVKDGNEISRFHTFADPGVKIPYSITELTGIKDSDVEGAPQQKEAVTAFLEFAGDRPLVAHNAGFDVGFIDEACIKYNIAGRLDKTEKVEEAGKTRNTANAGNAGGTRKAATINDTEEDHRHGGESVHKLNASVSSYAYSYIDTLALARVLLPDLKNHRLDTVASYFGHESFSHHRASDDAAITADIFYGLLKILRVSGVTAFERVNAYLAERYGAAERKGRVRYKHIIILAQNQIGIKNLYELITKSHLDDFNRYPCIRKSVLLQHREGLIIGSACESGEIFELISEKRSSLELHRLAGFYDYLEIQPVCNNMFMIFGDRPRAGDEEELRTYNKRVVELGRQTGKPVVATGDVHFLDPEDEIYRHVLLTSKDFDNADDNLPVFFKTTDEMLEEFSYLGEDTAYEVVVKNSRMIADMCETVSPLPPKKTLFAPKLEGSAAELQKLVEAKLRELYGDTPPAMVKKRADTELGDILKRSYDVIYMTAQKLVADAKMHGYLVGSRGSVGSSFIAFLAGVTEVNALPAHYRCGTCRTSDFESGAGYGCGADMPEARCPICGTQYIKDGFNIPFETFLGFGGDKVPDVDLNFSGEYQAQAHRFTTDLFGADFVFRAGTIGKIADKTAFGYVKHYLEVTGKTATKAEENRLARGCVGVKRTTGQHPGGLIVIPQDKAITDFCPAQHPADDKGTNIITTHFDYHCMEDNLIKLDELGHDDPTMIKMLEDLTGVSVDDIELGDRETMQLFLSPAVLGLPENDAVIGATGSIGIPEFGTDLTRQMLCDTKPDKFDTLVRLSGFSHGEGVWMGNARDLILSGKATVGETIGCRDDIMLFLISKGIDDRYAFKISESVRKGNDLPDGAEEDMSKCGVPAWYIESCRKIKYLFPKAHAVAYVMMAFRIAWFKVHKPLEFYCAHFYRRSQKDSFDAAIMTRGIKVVRAKINEIRKNTDAKAKEEELLTTLEACYEFYMRGYEFADIDVYESDPVKFLIVDENKLRPPFVAISGLGETAARDISEKRIGREFVSVDDLSALCTKVSKTHIEQLKALGALRDMPDSSQLSLF